MLRRLCFHRFVFCLLGCLFVVVFSLPWAILAKDYNTETGLFHQVAPGESLSKIARRYFPFTEAFTVRELVRKIQKQNNLEGTLIRPNQRLLIPVVRSTRAVSKTIPKSRDFEARGIYVNRYSTASSKMPRLIKRLIALGGNAVVLDGKDMSGRVSYRSRVPLAEEIGANASPLIDDPAKLFNSLHQMGLHICVRIVLFYDPFLAAKRPDLAVRSLTTGTAWKESGKVTWVDPSNPVVQRYNLDMARELAEMGVDEIQFDYIRFPTMGDTDDAAYGFDEEHTPKHQIISGFLAQAREELAPYKVLLSVDVFGVMGWGRPEDLHMTGQRIEDLAENCDVISPMIYPSHFYGHFQGMASPGDQPFFLVSEACRKFSTLLEGREVALRPWIQAFPFGASQFDEEYILEQLRALNESKSCGWLFWSAGNAYDVAWKALAEWNHAVLWQKSRKARFSWVEGSHGE